MSSIEIRDAKPYLRALKTLVKKYRSILVDIEELKKELRKNPFQGADLGNGMRTFLYIYDKSERSSISDNELRQLLESED